MCVCACVRVCVRACVRACVRVYVCNICHFSDHLTNLSTSSCNFYLSPISLVFLESLV